MTHGSGLVARTITCAASLYNRLVWGLEASLPLFDLSVRLYLAHIFWTGGMVKLSSWMSTVMLFTFSGQAEWSSSPVGCRP